MRALVLSGGGVKGAYQVGALAKWLGEDRIDYDVFCGASVGAINAAYLAQYNKGLAPHAYEGLARVWKNVSQKDLWSSWRFFGPLAAFWKPSVYNSRPLQKWLHDELRVDAIHRSGKKLRIPAVAWDTAEVHVATEQAPDLDRWVAASASYPVMMTPVKIEGRLWSDGGLRSVTPLGEAIRLGAEEVDVILCNDPDTMPDFSTKKAAALPDFLVRTFDIQSTQIQLADLAMAGLKNDLAALKPEFHRVRIRVLMPSKRLSYDPLVFDPGAVEDMMNQGYRDAHGPLRFYLYPRRNEGRTCPRRLPMLRLIHKQTIAGAILVDDIDDGLPNKTAHRMGSTADPKAYRRDGYANHTKQAAYIPRVKPTDKAIAGYIDLAQTQRVTLSAGKGKIKKLADAGLITVVDFTGDDVETPVITTATLSGGIVTIDGSGLDSLTPNLTKVTLTGTGGPLTLTQTQITGAGGTMDEAQIVIPASLVPGVATTTTSVRVTADDQLSNLVALS